VARRSVPRPQPPRWRVFRSKGWHRTSPFPRRAQRSFRLRLRFLLRLPPLNLLRPHLLRPPTRAWLRRHPSPRCRPRFRLQPRPLFRLRKRRDAVLRLRRWSPHRRFPPLNRVSQRRSLRTTELYPRGRVTPDRSRGFRLRGHSPSPRRNACFGPRSAGLFSVGPSLRWVGSRPAHLSHKASRSGTPTQ